MGKAVDQPVAEATRLGSYEILRKLARGGMAELFLARSVGPEGFEKLIVLKKILPTYADNPKFVKLFLDEARLAAGLDHPNIAHVYDMGMVDGNYFFTMEYVHGQDVRRTLKRTARLDQQFPLDHAVQIARNVAAALHYAHERHRPDGSLIDLVHRDVSPSNVLISYDGVVKLVDFGVAKAATSSVKTRTGALKGKISYMSPEQARGSPIDRRSDIFSLGIVLWEMVTTHRLFKAENDLATIQMIVNAKPPPPRQIRADCSTELERITLKALALDLDKRYQTAEELQLDLEELAREQKLKQSSVALRAHMHHLFGEEIKSWNTALESGTTLSEHFVRGSGHDMTEAISEDELSYLDDDEAHDIDSELPTAAVPITQPMQIGSMPGAFAAHDAPTRQMPIPVPVPKREASGRVGPVAPSVIVRSDTPPPTPVDTANQSGPMRPARPATFPVAPLEWRPPPIEQPQHATDLGDKKRRQLIVLAACGFSALVLLYLAVRSDVAPAATSMHVQAPVADPPPVTMQVTQPQDDPKPEPVEVAKPDPAPQPAVVPPPPAPPPPAPPPPAETAPKKALVPTKHVEKKKIEKPAERPAERPKPNDLDPLFPTGK